MAEELAKRDGQHPSWAIPVTRDVVGMRILIANLYFIGAPNSRDWVLADAGVGPCADRIERAAANRYGAGVPPKAIILTHGHFDHIGGLKTLAERWNAPIYAHELELPFLTGRSDYPPGDPSVGGGGMAYLSFLYPRRAIDLGRQVQALPADGSIPFLPGWLAVHTPGHTPGHVSLFRGEDRVLIAGDAIVTTKQEATVSAITQEPREVRRPPAYFTIDWQAAGQSVRKIADLNPSIVATGHGRPMQGAEMQRQLNDLALNFQSVGVPSQGRYVNEPATANESGIVSVPPATTASELPKIVAGVVAVGAGLAIVSALGGGRRKKPRVATPFNRSRQALRGKQRYGRRR